MIKVAVAADHGGYASKARVILTLKAIGDETLDLGTNSADPVD